jgi:ELWxxDGT repeat protein
MRGIESAGRHAAGRARRLLILSLAALAWFSSPPISAQAGSPSLVIDIVPGAGASNAEALMSAGGDLYFSARGQIISGDVNTALWKSDGTAAGTGIVRDGWRFFDLRPHRWTVFGGSLYFRACTAIDGCELWTTDGTEAGTVQAIEVGPFAANGSYGELTPVGSTLFFENGGEPWLTDGTQAGTMQIKDIRPGYSALSNGFTPVSGNVFFAAFTDEDGFELWKTDGTEAGTGMVADIDPRPVSYSDQVGSSSPHELTEAGGALFFAATTGAVTAGRRGVELWRSDGTAAGTVIVRDINPVGDSNPSELIEIGGTVYFAADDGASGVELWKSDGTRAGTKRVKDINGIGSSNPRSLTEMNGTLYFTAYKNPQQGRELWKSDGTAAGTVLVKDLNLLRPPPYDSTPIDDSDVLGTSDETGSSDPAELIVVDNTLFFSAFDPLHGRELWRSNGTANGTTVDDIAPGPAGSAPNQLFATGGRLYFTADDGSSGREIWSVVP